VSGRRHLNQTQVHLALGGLAIVIGVGGGLIWALYGPGAALAALGCILAAAIVFVALWFALLILERVVGED
jgi:hypothetical protein